MRFFRYHQARRSPPAFFGPGLLLLLFLLGLAGWPGGADAGGLSITSDRLEMDDERQRAVFAGNVQAEDGRIRLFADRMTVHYHTPKQDGRRGAGVAGVREVVAEGHVLIRESDHRGVADIARFHMGNNTLELIGKQRNAVINQGKDRLEGERIVLHLGEDRRIKRVMALGGKKTQHKQGRVTATINSSGGMSFGGSR